MRLVWAQGSFPIEKTPAAVAACIAEVARVLFLSHYALPHLGGIEVVVDALARELVARGHEVVHVASAALRPDETDRAIPETPYRVIRLPALNTLEQRWHVPWPVFSHKLAAVLAREVPRADVVHAHGLLYLDSCAALQLARGYERPVRIVTEHVGRVPYGNRVLDGVQAAALGSLGRASAAAAEAIVVLNGKVWSEMAALGSPARLAMIPNGVDVARYHPAAPGERRALRAALGWDDTPRLLFVGRVVKKKGVDLACAAAARLYPRARLVVVGPGEVDPALLGPHVEVLGALPPERVAELYRAADLFLLPSRGEGFPLTAQEAMASGLPAVLLDDPAYAGYRSEGLVTAAPDELAGAVSALLDPARRAAAGAAASAVARARFSWTIAVDAHLHLYDEVRAARDTVSRIGFVRYDLATVEKLPVVRRLLEGEAGPPATPCLDVGVGTGFQTFRAFDGAFTVALDAWRPNLEGFKAGLANGHRARTAPLQASAERLPFADLSVGTILCSEVLEHLEDDRGALVEMARVLRPGGVAVFTVPSLYYGFDAYMHLVGMKTVHDFPGPERHVRLGYTEEDLRARLGDVGLEVEEVAYLFRPFTKLAMEAVSVAHIAYQRIVHGRRSWTWSDAGEAEGGLAFRLYRLAFPFMRAVAALDKVLPIPGGFGLAVRARKPNRAGPLSGHAPD